jgi:CheY-like chemotaxis protein
LDVVCAADAWPVVADASQFESALLNLCLNARDAMPSGGALSVLAENVRVDEPTGDMEAGEYVVLSVADTGSGMPPEVVAQAFDPFFTTKSEGRGTGLGLAMVHGFATHSGGSARIASEPDKGTTVRLYLPRSAEPTAEQEPRAEDDAAGDQATPGQTVLVLEDDPTIRLLTVELLEELGYRALSAQDGSSALAILDTDARVDLLLSDVGLPRGMNGRQVAAAARKSRPALKVLFVTGYADIERFGGGPLDDGMSVLMKPFELSALARRIKGVLDGKNAPESELPATL